MALTVDQLQAQRDELLTTLNGTRSVEVSGRSVTYEGPSEVREALREIDAQIARLTSLQSSRVFVIQSNRGI